MLAMSEERKMETLTRCGSAGELITMLPYPSRADSRGRDVAPGCLVLVFHRFSNKFLLGSNQFGAQAGLGLIFVEFLLNSY